MRNIFCIFEAVTANQLKQPQRKQPIRNIEYIVNRNSQPISNMENIENREQLSEEELGKLVEGLSDRELEILYSFVVMEWDNLTEESRKVWSEILMALEYQNMENNGNN